MAQKIVTCPICNKEMPLPSNQFGYELLTNHVRKEHKERLVK